MMTYRITPHRAYEQGLQQSAKRTLQTQKLNQQVGSGIRVHQPSDDPAAMKVMLLQSSLIQSYETRQSAITSLNHTLSVSNSQLVQTQQLVVQAQEIALQARQSTDPAEAETFVAELETILTRMEQIANSKVDGVSIFAGTGLFSTPFSESGSGSTLYSGDMFAGGGQIPGSLALNVNEPGNLIFQQPTTGKVQIYSNTGIQAGAGTSVGSNSNVITLEHTATTYQAGSGIQSGTNAAQNTILGSAGTHQLQIQETSGDGTAGLISLNSGETIAFSNLDTNLKLTGPRGEVVYVDTSAITAGFNGTIDLTAQGRMTLNGEPPPQNINYSNQQTLTDSGHSVVIQLDTSQVTQIGQAVVIPQASQDLFQAVRGLKETIQNVYQLSPTERQEEFSRSIQNLERSSDHLLGIVGRQAVSLKTLETTQEQLFGLKLTAEQRLADAGSTDYLQAVAHLQEQQTLMQYSFYSMLSIQRVSLLDYLQ